MALTYTTTANIMRLLQGRLELVSSGSFGRTPIDPLLLDQVAAQAEATLDNVLRRLYQLPLQAAHPTLAEFVELRCVCRLIPVYYQRESASDDKGLGNSACGEAEAILERIESGAIKLDGETPIVDTPIGLQRQQTFVRQYNPNTVQDVGFDGRNPNRNRFSEVDR